MEQHSPTSAANAVYMPQSTAGLAPSSSHSGPHRRRRRRMDRTWTATSTSAITRTRRLTDGILPALKRSVTARGREFSFLFAHDPNRPEGHAGLRPLRRGAQAPGGVVVAVGDEPAVNRLVEARPPSMRTVFGSPLVAAETRNHGPMRYSSRRSQSRGPLPDARCSALGTRSLGAVVSLSAPWRPTPLAGFVPRRRWPAPTRRAPARTSASSRPRFTFRPPLRDQ